MFIATLIVTINAVSSFIWSYHAGGFEGLTCEGRNPPLHIWGLNQTNRQLTSSRWDGVLLDEEIRQQRLHNIKVYVEGNKVRCTPDEIERYEHYSSLMEVGGQTPGHL